MTAHPEAIPASLGEFETCPDWMPRLDKGAGTPPKLLFPKPLNWFELDRLSCRKSSKRVQTGEPNIKTPGGVKQARELFHRKPGLSDQRSKSPFGQFFMVGNGKASVRRVGVSKNDVAAVLLIEFVSSFAECLDCVTTGNDR
jgi:hypothetical protein